MFKNRLLRAIFLARATRDVPFSMLYLSAHSLALPKTQIFNH